MNRFKTRASSKKHLVPLALASTALVILVLATSARQFPLTASRVESDARPTAGPEGLAETNVEAAYGKRPLSFEANQGQTDGDVKFLARGSGYALY